MHVGLSQNEAWPSSGWPDQIVNLSRAWKSTPESPSRQQVLAELWLLVNAALTKYLRLHGRRGIPVGGEDLRDIAAQKSLELLHKLDEGTWDPALSESAQVCAFLSTVARNGLIDHIRVIESKRSRNATERGDPDLLADIDLGASDRMADVPLDRARYAEALRECAANFAPRAWKVWFMRVFLDMPSKQIALHPEVGMQPATVDMTLARCRERIGACMRSKGFEPGDMPPGTFAVLWEEFRYEIGSDTAPLTHDQDGSMS